MNQAIYARMAEVENRHWWFASRRAIIQSRIDALKLRSDSTILEVGCGSGGNLPMLSSYGQVYAMEPYDSARAIAAALRVAKVAAGRLPEDVPFEGLDFDLVVMTDVLEHLSEEFKSLRAIRSRLKSTGRLLLTVPAMPHLWSQHDVSHHHYRRYRAHELRSILEWSGFQVQYLNHYNSFLYGPIVAVRMAQRMLGLRSSEGHDLRMPSPFINGMLQKIFTSERRLIASRRVPFGVSLIAIAKKAGARCESLAAA